MGWVEARARFAASSGCSKSQPVVPTFAPPIRAQRLRRAWQTGIVGRRWLALLVLLVLAGGSACETRDASTSSDAAVDADDPFVPPGTMTIRVRNDGTRMLYVQASGWSGQEVTAISKPGGVAVGRDTCEVCNCLTCPSCAVCGRSLAQVAEILPGAWLDFSWDQTDWSVIEDGCRPTLACEQPVLVPPGPLTAHADYSDTFTATTMFGAEESFIGPSIHAATEFQHPAFGVVVVSLQ